MGESIQTWGPSDRVAFKDFQFLLVNCGRHFVKNVGKGIPGSKVGLSGGRATEAAKCSEAEVK